MPICTRGPSQGAPAGHCSSVNLLHRFAGGMGTGTLTVQGASTAGYTRIVPRHMPWFMPGASAHSAAESSRNSGSQRAPGPAHSTDSTPKKRLARGSSSTLAAACAQAPGANIARRRCSVSEGAQFFARHAPSRKKAGPGSVGSSASSSATLATCTARAKHFSMALTSELSALAGSAPMSTAVAVVRPKLMASSCTCASSSPASGCTRR